MRSKRTTSTSSKTEIIVKILNNKTSRKKQLTKKPKFSNSSYQRPPNRACKITSQRSKTRTRKKTEHPKPPYMHPEEPPTPPEARHKSAKTNPIA
jgi:hypothetical protein